MDVNINTLSSVAHEAEIRLSDEELQPEFEKAYQRHRKDISLKGFRKGKVPLEMVKKLYGEAIEYEALDTLAGEFYRRAMKERNIRPIGMPEVTDMDFKRGQGMRFTIRYETKPEIILQDYKNLDVEKPVRRVTDKDLDAEIRQIRWVNSTTSKVQSVTDEQHIVTCDIQELDPTGAPLVGKKVRNTKFYLDDRGVVPEIKSTLMNAEVGGSYRTSFESGTGEQKRMNHIEITVSKIEKVHLPDFNDELVKKISDGKVTTTHEFLQNMRADLQRYWDDRSERALSDAIAAELVRRHEFPVPDAIVNAFLDGFIGEIKARSKTRTLPADFDETKFRDENRAYAVWQARWMLLKEKIADAEGITVTPADVERLAETEAASTGLPIERILQYYSVSGSLDERLLTGKLMAFLKSNATIRERLVEDSPEE